MCYNGRFSASKICKIDFTWILSDGKIMKFPHCTMLQKLSKCEVKAWLCLKKILRSLIFYVKSNFGEFKRSKNVIFGNCRDSQFWFLVNFSIFQEPNLPKFKVLSLYNCQKCHFWTIWIRQNWISREIWVEVNWSNLNKVKP